MVKREVHEQDLASVISTYTTSSWMAVCYCQPAYCLQTGNGRLSACAKINLLTFQPPLYNIYAETQEYFQMLLATVS